MEKNYKIEYLPSAINDLQGIFSYISGDLSAPQTAHNLLDKFDRSIDRLAAYPFSCEKAKDTVLNSKGYRILVVEHYLVFYIVSGEIVEVRRVLYNKQSYKWILE